MSRWWMYCGQEEGRFSRWQKEEAPPASEADSYLQVGLLAALHQLVEGRCPQVSVHVGGVEPLQRVHDDLLENKRTQHTFGCSHTELVHVVYSWQRPKVVGGRGEDIFR